MCTTCGCAEGNLYIEGDEHNPHSAFRSAPFAPAARPALNITGIKTPDFAPSQTAEGDLALRPRRSRNPRAWYESAADAGG